MVAAFGAAGGLPVDGSPELAGALLAVAAPLLGVADDIAAPVPPGLTNPRRHVRKKHVRKERRKEMAKIIEQLGDRLLSLLVPRTTAAADVGIGRCWTAAKCGSSCAGHYASWRNLYTCCRSAAGNITCTYRERSCVC